MATGSERPSYQVKEECRFICLECDPGIYRLGMAVRVVLCAEGRRGGQFLDELVGDCGQ